MAVSYGCEDVVKDWIIESFAINGTALAELGFTADQLEIDFPSVEGVADSITPSEAVFIAERLEQKVGDTFVMTPIVRWVGLVARNGLVTRFDAQRPRNSRSFVQANQWGRPSDRSLLHDNGRVWPSFQVGVLLADTHLSPEPGDIDQVPIEAGLALTSNNVDSQRSLFEAERQSFDSQELTLDLATIAQIVVVNAQRRIAGQKLLDSHGTATRFIQYPDRSSPMGTGPYCINTACIRDDRFWLGGSVVTQASPNEGVRRSLRISTTPR
ncbi:MAG TPA: hypothetical protein VIH90_07275 [Candidatus Saccharimonadales bacterium]